MRNRRTPARSFTRIQGTKGVSSLLNAIARSSRRMQALATCCLLPARRTRMIGHSRSPEVSREIGQALSHHLLYGASPSFPATTKESTSICHSSNSPISSAVLRISLSQLFESHDRLTVTRPS